MDKIQMVDLLSQYEDIKEDIDSAIQEVIITTSFINGSAVKNFTENLAKWNNSEFVVPCANGTDGLQIALMALGIKSGDEVIVPVFTYIATVEVITLLGIRPVFVDVNPDTFCLEAKSIKNVLTKKTKAIVPVHLYGQCVDMDPVVELASKNGLYIIEDLAQAIGSQYKNRKTGNLGHIGVTSFFPSKNLGCFGDGGAIFTNDVELFNKIKMIANHGQSRKYYHDIVGVNSRLDTIQAAILNEKLKRLDQYITSRREAAKIYDSELEELSDFISIPKQSSYSSHVYHQYTIKVRTRRNELKQYLQDKGIPSMIYYPLPITHQKAYAHYTEEEFPSAIALADQVLSLPMHTHLERDQLSFICQTIRDFFE